MRRIRTMDGKLIDREESVKDYEGNIIKKSDSVMNFPDGVLFHKDSKKLVKSYFDKYILRQNAKVFSVIERGVVTNHYVHTMEVRQHNDAILGVYSKERYIVLCANTKFSDKSTYIFKDQAQEFGVYRRYQDTNGTYSTSEVSKNSLPSEIKQYHKFSNIYNPGEGTIESQRFYGTTSPTFLITEGIRNKFGIELETGDGYLLAQDYHPLNVKCVRDGSLKDNHGHEWGGEYVTGILQGDLGFNQVNNLCKELSKICTVNNRCGFHIHVNIKPSSLFIVNLYKTLLLIEKEMFQLVPKNRRNGPHSKCLPKLPSLKEIKLSLKDKDDRSYIENTLFDWIRQAVAYRGVSQSSSKYQRHPLGDKCGYDKDTMRYCWVNFVPALFLRDSYKGAPKDYQDFTIEFRSHPGTLNFNKVKNWSKLCMAIVHYVENHLDIIYKPESFTLSLDTIVKYCYPKSGKALLQYMADRESLFRESKGEDKDYQTDDEGESINNLAQLIK